MPFSLDESLMPFNYEAEFKQLTLDNKIDVIIDSALRKIRKQYPLRSGKYCIERRPGKKYLKLMCAEIQEDGERLHTEVWCFIDTATGHVYKPASYKAPAKHVRYDLNQPESFYAAARMADWFGSWLYIKH